MDEMQLEHVSEFKYLRCVLDESGTDKAQCRIKVTSERRVADAIKSQVNARGLQFECATILHEILLMPVFIYGSGTMIWKEKKSSKIMDVQMSSLRGLLGIGIKSQMHG